MTPDRCEKLKLAALYLGELCGVYYDDELAVIGELQARVVNKRDMWKGQQVGEQERLARYEREISDLKAQVRALSKPDIDPLQAQPTNIVCTICKKPLPDTLLGHIPDECCRGHL